MEALTQPEEILGYNDLIECIDDMCENKLFLDVMKDIIKAIMEKERKKNKELVIIPLFADRIMNCYSYFERSGLSNMITNNQYCRRLHLPIINCITNKAVQAITNDK